MDAELFCHGDVGGQKPFLARASPYYYFLFLGLPGKIVVAPRPPARHCPGALGLGPETSDRVNGRVRPGKRLWPRRTVGFGILENGAKARPSFRGVPARNVQPEHRPSLRKDRAHGPAIRLAPRPQFCQPDRLVPRIVRNFLGPATLAVLPAKAMEPARPSRSQFIGSRFPPSVFWRTRVLFFLKGCSFSTNRLRLSHRKVRPFLGGTAKQSALAGVANGARGPSGCCLPRRGPWCPKPGEPWIQTNSMSFFFFFSHRPGCISPPPGTAERGKRRGGFFPRKPRPVAEEGEQRLFGAGMAGQTHGCVFGFASAFFGRRKRERQGCQRERRT